MTPSQTSCRRNQPLHYTNSNEDNLWKKSIISICFTTRQSSAKRLHKSPEITSKITPYHVKYVKVYSMIAIDMEISVFDHNLVLQAWLSLNWDTCCCTCSSSRNFYFSSCCHYNYWRCCCCRYVCSCYASAAVARCIISLRSVFKYHCGQIWDW